MSVCVQIIYLFRILQAGQDSQISPNFHFRLPSSNIPDTILTVDKLSTTRVSVK